MLARQAVLVELARVRLHGLTQREMLAAAQVQMAETESLYTERAQEYSDSRRCEAGSKPYSFPVPALLRYSIRSAMHSFVAGHSEVRF